MYKERKKLCSFKKVSNRILAKIALTPTKELVNYDYYTNKEISDYSVEVREEFRTLYRDIQISMIL